MKRVPTANGIPERPMRFFRIWIIWQQYNPDYVLILSGDHIYKMDYEVMLDYHKANKADVTIACYAGSDRRSKPLRDHGYR